MNENIQENVTTSEESLQSNSDSPEVVTENNTDDSVESGPIDNPDQTNTEQILPSHEESSESNESSSSDESRSSDSESYSDESVVSNEDNLEESIAEPTSTVIQFSLPE